MRDRLTKLRKRRKRRRKNRPITVSNPDLMIDPTTAPLEVLVEAYALGIAWDNSDNAFVAELSDFGVEIQASTWQEAVSCAKEAQRLLIQVYRSQGYTLPDL